MIPAIIVVGVMAIDQLTKWIVRANMCVGESVDIIGNFFCLKYIKNTGTAFSMFENNLWITLGLTTGLLVVCLFFILHEWRSGSRGIAIAMSFVFAGGMSNLVDRFMLGFVTDMISVGSFAIFNVADIAVTLGCVFVVVVLLFSEKYGGTDER